MNCRPLIGCGHLLAGACASLHAQQPRFTVITGATLIDGTARPAMQDAVIKNVTRINRAYKGGVAYDPVDPAWPFPGRGPR